MRLDKYLTSCYLGTRKEVKNIIKQKRIKVNGIITTKDNFEIDENKDIVALDDKALKYQKYYYYLLNKPKDYVSATYDTINKTVVELFLDLPPLLQKELFPVGRLDKDTEGMIIVTNDGDFSHKVTSPKHHVKKTYYVEYEGLLDENSEELLKNGLKDENGITFLPAIIKRISNSSCYLTIEEGKYHQVKRMIHILGGILTYLKRVKIGDLSLPSDLELGKYIELAEDDISKLISE